MPKTEQDNWKDGLRKAIENKICEITKDGDIIEISIEDVWITFDAQITIGLPLKELEDGSG